MAKEGDKRIGNQFWRLAPKVGRKRIFETPEILWEACCEYFQWSKDNPLIEYDWKGKPLQKIEIPKIRAMSHSGLAFFLGVSTGYLPMMLERMSKKDDEESKEFVNILTRIEQTIFTQNYEGAAANLLNPMIVARYLGIKEKQEFEIQTTADEHKNREEFLKKIERAKVE